MELFSIRIQRTFQLVSTPGKDRAGAILQNNTLLPHSPEEQAQTISR